MGSIVDYIIDCLKRNKDEDNQNKNVKINVQQEIMPKEFIFETQSHEDKSSSMSNKMPGINIYNKKTDSLKDHEVINIEMKNFSDKDDNQPKIIYNERIELLDEKQKELEDKENQIKKDLIDISEKRQELETNKKGLEVWKENLDKREHELNEREKELNIRDENLKNKEKNLIDEEDNDLIEEKENLVQKEKDDLLKIKKENEDKEKELEIRKENLDNLEQDIKNQEEELKKNIEQFNFNRENQENLMNEEKKEIIEKNENLIKIEKNLKDQESELEAKEFELKKKEKKFNEEKLIQEKNCKQKEVILNQFKISLDQEKKDFEDKKKKEELSKLPNLVGLQNIGATCYMNATLQALSNTKSLTDFFLTKYKFDANAYNKKMANEYYKVLTNLWSDEKKNGDYPPYDFKQAISEENPLFAGIQANDSKDLINFLLERFHQELNYAKKSNNDNEIVNVNQMDEMQTLKVFISDYFNSNQSIITDCFYGMLETKSKCTGCQLTKYNFQIYSFLEFPLEQVNIFMFQMGRRFNMMNQGQNPDIDLLECFEYYQKTDYMNGQNQMYCNICNMNMDTYYGSNIYSLPNYLIINLNRGKGAVYECKVNFPENLNLLNFVTFKQGKTYFQLYAVICHLGPSSMSGHFVAYCRHKNNDKWYKYNDSFVTECTKPQEYNEGMPYILFYRAV